MPSAANEDKTVMVKFQLTTMSTPEAKGMKAKLAAKGFRDKLTKMFRMYGLLVSADAIVTNLQTSQHDKMIPTLNRDAYLASRHETMSPTPATKRDRPTPTPAPPTPPPATATATATSQPAHASGASASHAAASASASAPSAASASASASATPVAGGSGGDGVLIAVLVVAVFGLVG
jgi:hypothetical protein